MAAVLDAFAPYVNKLIEDLPEYEVAMLLGISNDEITKLKNNIQSLGAFAADAERRRVTDMSMQRWVRKFKDVMYDATDFRDLYQLEADKRRDPLDGTGLEEKVPGCFQQFLICLRNPLRAHEIGSRIKELNQRLEGILKEASRFNININIGYNPESRMPLFSKKSSEFYESVIVGEQIERDTRELVQMLITADNTIKVMSIVGTGGMGKTTLAQKIFNDATIQEHFRYRIWLSITHDFDDCELLRTAITQAGAIHGGTRDKTLLVRTLVNSLSTGRFLLVMDDVWSDQAWSHVLSVPVRHASQKQPGNWILVTTRFADLAQRMGASFYQHHVRPLDMEVAWCLLKKQLPSDQDHQVDLLKDIGMEILKRCGGLPLAVKVVGALLNTRYPREREWQSVLNNPAWSDGLLHPELYNWLYLSYEDLSPQLKQCFLYCSLFPKGQKIIQSTITSMWVSEGFILPPDGNSTQECELEDIAIVYYLELKKRNLIEPMEGFTAHICRMHDVVHSFAQYMAREEAWVVQEQQDISNQSILIRRLFVESTKSIQVEWAVLQKQVSLRALIINSEIEVKPGDSLRGFSSLRILHVVGLAESDWLLSSLCQLKHLRYLHLNKSDVSRLPDDIGRMKFLQYIEIVNCNRIVRLPGSIIKLTQLRSLDLVGSSVEVVPKEFGSLTNLRSLFGFPVHMDGDWCSLQELGPLHQLRSLRLEGIENVDKSYFAAKANIISKEHLRILHFSCRDSFTSRSANVSSSEQQQKMVIQELYEHLTPPTCIETLVIEGYIGHRLPNWMWMPSAEAFKSLTHMELRDLYCTKLPDGLSQMPSLECLKINEAPIIKYVGPEFLHQVGLQFAFPRLQKLILWEMVEWEDWQWYPFSGVEAMPVLQELSVKNCKLTTFPRGLSYHSRALRQLTIADAQLLTCLEGFSCLVELYIFFCPELSRISGLPRLQKLTIKICPKLIVLEGVPELRSLVVEDYRMKTLPEYLQCIRPRYLSLDCTRELLKSIGKQDDDSEWHKICHIQHVKVYAGDGGYQRSCYYLLYTKEPYSFEMTLDSEEELTGDELVGSDIPSGGLTGEDSPLFNNDTDLVFSKKNELVGIQSAREEVIKMLMHGQETGNQQLQVVSICGIGGLGKTSIAKAVYTQIGNQFKCRAFVMVSADNEGIIKDIINQVGCPYPNLEDIASQQRNNQLIDKLNEFLQNQRYLIVVDDIRDVSVWETIKPALIGNNHGSGIITTTYKVDVAEAIGGVYRLPLLSEVDSKKLFYRGTYFGSEDQCPSEYRDLSKRILNKCGQLPLAITTITSLLPNRLNSEEQWAKVCESIGSGRDDRLKDMRRILSRSYDDLPQHLRTCFLYLCIFPEDYVIRRDSLVRRWLSEDLIRDGAPPKPPLKNLTIDEEEVEEQEQGGEGKERKEEEEVGGEPPLICGTGSAPGDHRQNLQELGEAYFYQLLDTGLIQPIEHDDYGKALACRVPGVMIDLIASLLIEEEKRSLKNKSEEKCDHKEETEENCGLPKKIEDLRKRIEEKVATRSAAQRQSDIPNKVKRLSLQVNKEQHVVAKATKSLGASASTISSSGKTVKSFRQGSLSIFCTTDSMVTLPVYKNLTVLVLEGSLENQHIAKYFGSLRQLRCLILASTQITKIPKKVGNLQFLHTLDLRATNVHELPCRLAGLKQLRCLLINRSTKVPAEICNLQALEEVLEIGISKPEGILEGICTLPELRVLKIALRSWDESSSKLLNETLSKLSKKKLKHLSICTSSSLELKIDDDKQNEVFQHIEKLEIQHSMFDRLPTWIGILSKLVYLSIEVYLLEKDALRILGQLPALLFLSLTAKKTPELRPAANRVPAEVRPHANRIPEVRPASEDRLVVGSGAFGCLKTFHLFSRAIGIKFEQGCMINLERFKLSFQASLTTDDFSFGLENLSSLKHVQVEIICFSATEKVVKKAEDAIRGMIWGSPNLPRPALDMRRSREECMIQEKREFREELRGLICASWDRRTASVQ